MMRLRPQAASDVPFCTAAVFERPQEDFVDGLDNFVFRALWTLQNA